MATLKAATAPAPGASTPRPGRMAETIAQGADFWNDSCAPSELAEAVAAGAVGATSNPVIVFTAVKSDPATWMPVLDELIRDRPQATEDELAWALIEALGRRAAALLLPVYERTAGAKGFLSMQVSPKLYRDPDRMREHGLALAVLAPNVAVKVPATAAGLAAAEELVAQGVNVNATVSFTLSQAMAAAEAFERGLERARRDGRDMARLHPYVTLMVGRLDDHLQRLMTKQGVAIDPGLLHWAGIAVFKKARTLFRARGFRGTLLAAAYRHHLHWSELIGPGVVLSMPYAWWKQFDASDIEVGPSLDRPLEPRIVQALQRKFEDFRRAYDEGGIAPEDFGSYGASVHTLQQFLGGYQDLVGLVRERMLRP
jgi:transaldolase